MVLEKIILSTKTMLSGTIDTAITLVPKLILALVIILVGRRISKYAIKYAGPIVARTFKRPDIIKMALRSIKYTIFLIAILIALDVLGVSLTPLLAGAGIAGIIIGVTVAPVVSGYLAGIFLIVDRPFEVGDRIEFLGMEPPLIGYVEEIGFRVSKIRTLEGNLVVLSNSGIANKDIVNYSSEDVRTRAELPVGIAYESDLDKAIEIMVNAARETKGVILEGKINIGGVEYELKPQVLITGFGASSVDLFLRVWFKDPYYPRRRTSLIYKKIFEEFKKQDIEIPYPHRDLVIKDYVFKGLSSSFKAK